MSPIPMEKLTGRYTSGNVVLSWTYPTGAPNTVYIIPVIGVGPSKRADVGRMIPCPLKSVQTGYGFSYPSRSSYDVTRNEFLVFLGNSNEPLPNFVNMYDNPAFTVYVTVGRALVYYWIDTKAVEHSYNRHVLSLESQYSIEAGIVGYSFWHGQQLFSVPIPDSLKREKRKFPPFFTPHGSNISVVVVDGANADVAFESKKIFKW